MKDKRARLPILPLLGCIVLTAVQSVMAQANLPVYSENLVNDFQDWSFACTRSFTNTNSIYVHSGTNSISVTITSSGGTLYLHSPDFNTSPYTNLSFWINGGPTGGQQLQVRGVTGGNSGTAFSLGALPANTWQQFTIPLSTLGVAGKSNFDGIWIQSSAGSSQPVYYVDDMQIGAAPAPGVVNLSVDASQVIRAADARWFGVNTATWDSFLGNSATLPALTNAGVLVLRWPGGSTADAYHWTNDSNGNKNFRNVATNLGAGAQAFITVNYGTGTSNEAAAWVLSANITNHCHFKYWEIGNEVYGASWETDSNTPAHDPYTYAVRAAGYMQLMRAADPTIKIGVVAVPGDSTDVNNMNHPVVNPRTHATVYGWTPVMLTTLSNLGAMPDFLIYHFYPEYTPDPWVFPDASPDSDPLLLQVGTNWAGDASTLRQELTDFIGAPGSNIELCVTENNCDSALGCKQLSSLVNSLYMVDSMAQLMKTEFNSYLWWDLRNGAAAGGDFDPTIYGWRTNGDEGILTGASSKNPDYYGLRLMQYFMRPGDSVLASGSSYQLLSAYGARKADGSLAVLVINKDSTTNFNGQINLANYSPWTNATIHTYGIAEDNATKNNLSATLQDIAVTNAYVSGNPFTYSFPPYSMTVFTIPPAGPSLQVLSASPGAVVMQLQGQTGAPYVIQTSPDMVSWSPVSTNLLAASPMSVTNPVSAGSAQYWRAFWQP
jgi:hypothetical protein